MIPLYMDLHWCQYTPPDLPRIQCPVFIGPKLTLRHKDFLQRNSEKQRLVDDNPHMAGSPNPNFPLAVDPGSFSKKRNYDDSQTHPTNDVTDVESPKKRGKRRRVNDVEQGSSNDPLTDSKEKLEAKSRAAEAAKTVRSEVPNSRSLR